MKDIDLKPGSRGFQAGILSNQKTSDTSRLDEVRNGRHLPNRRDW